MLCYNKSFFRFQHFHKMEQKYLKGSSGGNNGENESSGNNGENVIVISNCCSANCPRNSGMLEFNLFQILTFLNRAGPERRNKNAKMIFIQKCRDVSCLVL